MSIIRTFPYGPVSQTEERAPGHHVSLAGAPAADAGGMTPLQVAMKRKMQILLFAVTTTLLVGMGVWQLAPRYDASASMMIDLRQPHLSGGEALLSSQIIDLDLLRTYMEALRSPSLARQVVGQLDLTHMREFCAKPAAPGAAVLHRLAGLLSRRAEPAAAPPCQLSADQVARRLTAAVSFGNDGRSYVMTVTATAQDAELAARMANAYAADFVARRRELQAGLTAQADGWLRAHVAELRQAVAVADDAVQRQRQVNQLSSLSGQTLLAQSLSQINAQLIVANGELAQKQSTLRELEDAAHTGAHQLDASAPILASPIIQDLLQRESMLSATEADLSSRMGNGNTELRASQASVAHIRQQIHLEIGKALSSVRGEVAALQARSAALQQNVQVLQDRLGRQGEAETRLEDLQRDAASARSRFDDAALRLEQIHLEAAVQRSDVQLLVEAIPAEFPSFPRKGMIVVGTFMAMLGVGAALAYALELLSRVFTTPEQLEEQTGIRVIGLFPKTVMGRQASTAATTTDTREAEALQAVFAGLIRGRFHGDAKAGRVMMVTSALPGEGKTSFSVGLALAATARGLSVALVDGDLRRPSLRSHFPQLDTAQAADAYRAAPDQPGRSGRFPGGFDELAVDSVSGLHVLTTCHPGATNPHAILGSASLPRALQALRADHDVIIIDTPPVLAVSDMLSIAPLVDDVVFLVGWRQTPRANVLAALQALHRAQIEVTGLVLSKVDMRRFARANRNGSHYAKLYPGYHAAMRG